MASTYVNDLRIEEQATGENSGTWGTKVNSAFSQIAEAFSYGTKQLAADANETFTMPDGTSDGTRSLYLKITSAGSLTATRTVTLGPNTVSKLWIIENATTGSQSITIAQGSGGTVTIPTGAVKMVYSDGAGSGAAVVDALTDVYLASVDHAAFGDNKKAIFGAGSDLQIYHDGSHSRIDDAGTGKLILRGNDAVEIHKYTGEYMITAVADGAVTLYHDDSAKLATTSTGVDVTGTLSADGLTVDGSSTAQINGSDSTLSGTNFDVHLLVGATGGGVRLGEESTTNDSFVGTTGTNDLQFVTYNGSSWGSRMTLTNGGNVGIGTSPSGANLHLDSNDTDVTIRLENSTQSGGYIQYTSADELRFYTGAAIRTTIDSSGNLLVGTTQTPATLITTSTTSHAGTGISDIGYLSVARDLTSFPNSGGVAFFNRLATDGPIADFRKDGVSVGSIGTLSGYITIGRDDTAIVFQSAEDNIQPFNQTTNSGRDAAIDLGKDTVRFKDLYLSGGISSSGNRNSLDISNGSTGIGRIECKDEFGIADDSTTTLLDSECGACLIHVYDNSTGDGAVYFATYQGGTQIIARDRSSLFSTSDEDGKYCLYKSSSSHNLVFKNRIGSTRSMSILIVGAQAAKSS